MVSLFPALALALCVISVAYGYYHMRARQVSFLDADDIVVLGPDAQEAHGKSSIFDRIATSYVPTVQKLLGTTFIAWLDKQIAAAGPGVTTRQAELRNIAKLALFLLPVGIIYLLQGQLFLLPACLAASVIFPVSRLATKARKRRERIESDLPDFLDVLAVTVSAGLAFRASLQRVSDYFKGPLSEEVLFALQQMDHGLTTRAAFSDLRDRIRSPLIERFVRAFLQAEELGAPLATTLNEIALDIRRDSAQAARKKAAQVAPRISLITTVILIPAAILLLVVGMWLGMDIDLGSLGM